MRSALAFVVYLTDQMTFVSVTVLGAASLAAGAAGHTSFLYLFAVSLLLFIRKTVVLNRLHDALLLKIGDWHCSGDGCVACQIKHHVGF